MAVLPIRLYPDPVLRVRCPEVVEFDQDLASLIDDMVDTMHAAPGIGLAAPQVGIEKRLAVVDLSVGDDPDQLMVLVNPRISSPVDSCVEEEGCLSIPELNEKVTRPRQIEVQAQSASGEAFEFSASGWLARAICHEVDHLDGVLFIDHLRGLRRERAKRFLKRMLRSA